MARELTPAERDELTPGELAAIMGENTEAAAGAALADATAASTAAERQDEAEGDAQAAAAAKAAAGEEGEAGEKPADDDQSAATTEEAEEDGEPSADALQAVLDEATSAPAVPPAPVKYQGITEADYKKEAGAISADKGALMKQLMDGEIDAEAFGVKDAELAERRDKLTASYTLAQANREADASRQTVMVNDLQANIGKLMKASTGTPLDYNSDTKAQKQFDMALQQLASDADNEHLTPAQLVTEADKVVRALRGAAPAAAPAPSPAPTPAGKTPARQSAPPPTTLGGIPAAAPNNLAGDVRSQFAMLQGDEAEDFLARQPAHVRQALLQGGMV